MKRSTSVLAKITRLEYTDCAVAGELAACSWRSEPRIWSNAARCCSSMGGGGAGAELTGATGGVSNPSPK